MPYDEFSYNFISESSPIIDYIGGSFYSSDLRSDNSLFLSDNESGRSNYQYFENGESEVDTTDYSDLLGSISSDCSVLTEQVQSLTFQVDNLNNNVVTLNENIKFGVGLIFTITFIVFIRTVFSVFNKVLGLNQA